MKTSILLPKAKVRFIFWEFLPNTLLTFSWQRAHTATYRTTWPYPFQFQKRHHDESFDVVPGSSISQLPAVEEKLFPVGWPLHPCGTVHSPLTHIHPYPSISISISHTHPTSDESAAEGQTAFWAIVARRGSEFRWHIYAAVGRQSATRIMDTSNRRWNPHAPKKTRAKKRELLAKI